MSKMLAWTKHGINVHTASDGVHIYRVSGSRGRWRVTWRPLDKKMASILLSSGERLLAEGKALAERHSDRLLRQLPFLKECGILLPELNSKIVKSQHGFEIYINGAYRGFEHSRDSAYERIEQLRIEFALAAKRIAREAARPAVKAYATIKVENEIEVALEAQGTGLDPTCRLLGKIQIGTIDLHVEAIAVSGDGEDEMQVAESDDFEEELTGLYNLANADSPFETMAINGRNYVLYCTPFAS